MEFLRTIAHLFFTLILLVASILLSAVVYESYRRRNNNKHIDAPAVFEDPNSLKQVPCPHLVDPAEKYISLIIPAFNEEHRLPAALDETINYLQQRAAKDKSFTYEVLIVDDGSSDATKRVAFDFVRKHSVDKVRVILLGRNHGKGEAIRKGMLHSRGELLLMLDADGATKVNDLEKLENKVPYLIRALANTEDTKDGKSGFRIGDIPVAAFGSRAHLEEKALASVQSYHPSLSVNNVSTFHSSPLFHCCLI
ncbi:Dolichyl-phosphate beta-glucosyltransferase [Linum perenne]